MRKMDYYWTKWSHWEDDGIHCPRQVLDKDAPESAKASYKRYLEQSAIAQRDIDSGVSMD